MGPSAPPMMEMAAVKAHEDGQEIGHVDAQLSRRAHEEALGVGDEGAEVRHGSHAHEDQGREDAPLIQDVKVVEQSAHSVGGILRRQHDVRVDIYQQHAEGDRHQKQGLKSFPDGQI